MPMLCRMCREVLRISLENIKKRGKLKVELMIKTVVFSVVNQGPGSMPIAFNKHSIIGDTWQDT